MKILHIVGYILIRDCSYVELPLPIKSRKFVFRVSKDIVEKLPLTVTAYAALRLRHKCQTQADRIFTIRISQFKLSGSYVHDDMVQNMLQ